MGKHINIICQCHNLKKYNLPSTTGNRLKGTYHVHVIFLNPKGYKVPSVHRSAWNH